MGARITLLRNLDSATSIELIHFLKTTVKLFCFFWVYLACYLIVVGFYDNLAASLVVIGLMILYTIYIILFRQLVYVDSSSSSLLYYTAAISVVLMITNPIYFIYFLVKHWDTNNVLYMVGLVAQVYFEAILMSTLYILSKLNLSLRKDEEEMQRQLLEGGGADYYVECPAVEYGDNVEQKGSGNLQQSSDGQ